MSLLWKAKTGDKKYWKVFQVSFVSLPLLPSNIDEMTPPPPYPPQSMLQDVLHSSLSRKTLVSRWRGGVSQFGWRYGEGIEMCPSLQLKVSRVSRGFVGDCILASLETQNEWISLVLLKTVLLRWNYPLSAVTAAQMTRSKMHWNVQFLQVRKLSWKNCPKCIYVWFASPGKFIWYLSLSFAGIFFCMIKGTK